MTRASKTIIIIISAIALIVIGGLYFLNSFFSAFAPAKVTIAENYISTNRDFINGITIEMLNVDSMGDKHPIKYTVTYLTTCHIVHQKTDRLIPQIKSTLVKRENIGGRRNM